jgi:GntR family transcriptional regulator
MATLVPAPTPEPPIIGLDLASPVPKYRQIVDQVRGLVAEGSLPAGTPLPSVRQLAADLSINVNTVLVAYRALESEGIVLLRHGSRAIVHPRLARLPSPQPEDAVRLRGLLERVKTDASLLGFTPAALCAIAVEVFGDGALAEGQS